MLQLTVVVVGVAVDGVVVVVVVGVVVVLADGGVGDGVVCCWRCWC